MTDKQRDAIILAKTKEEAEYLKQKIREYGDIYDPEWAKTDWWPNKYPDF